MHFIKLKPPDVWVKFLRVQWSWAHLDSFSKAKNKQLVSLQLPFEQNLKIFEEIANELSRSITDNDDCNDLSLGCQRCTLQMCSPYTLKRWHLLCDSVTVPGTASEPALQFSCWSCQLRNPLSAHKFLFCCSQILFLQECWLIQLMGPPNIIRTLSSTRV